MCPIIPVKECIAELDIRFGSTWKIGVWHRKQRMSGLHGAVMRPLLQEACTRHPHWRETGLLSPVRASRPQRPQILNVVGGASKKASNTPCRESSKLGSIAKTVVKKPSDNLKCETELSRKSTLEKKCFEKANCCVWLSFLRKTIANWFFYHFSGMTTLNIFKLSGLCSTTWYVYRGAVSPRKRLANCKSFGMMVTRRACMAHKFASDSSPVMYSSAAVWRAHRAVDCQRSTQMFEKEKYGKNKYIQFCSLVQSLEPSVGKEFCEWANLCSSDTCESPSKRPFQDGIDEVSWHPEGLVLSTCERLKDNQNKRLERKVTTFCSELMARSLTSRALSSSLLGSCHFWMSCATARHSKSIRSQHQHRHQHPMLSLDILD